MDGFSWLLGVLCGVIFFGILLAVTGAVRPEHYRQQNVCEFVGGTWHGKDKLCIRDRVVLDIPKDDK